MNYTTKRGYRIALKQNTQQMPLDAELEREGFNSKTRARFFNRIWHPFLPRKVSAMQWLVLTQGLPVGEWREKIGLPSDCELCTTPTKETLQHALKDCPHICRVWELFRNTRKAAGLPPSYCTWSDISRGLMRDPPGPQVEEELRWDTASAFSLNADTPWDILRAQLLWSIWCQKVAHTFRDDKFHIGVVLWHAWRNTIYCAMEAYKELFRHKRNEEKRQELIKCFQQVWTKSNIFGRLQGNTIKWNVTPHLEFLPRELGAWTIPPIRINRLSPSPDVEAEFTARPDFPNLVDEFLRNVGNNWQPPPAATSEDEHRSPQASPENVQYHTSTPHSQGEQSYQMDSSGGTAHIDQMFAAQEVEQLSEEASNTPLTTNHLTTQPTSYEESYQATLPETHKTAPSMARETDTFCPPSPKVATRPRCRPKKRCTRRLQHPMRRFKKERLWNQQSHSSVSEKKAKELPTTQTSPLRNSCSNRDNEPSHTDRSKPTSRPKRKCRFGPRARRSSHGHRSQGLDSFPGHTKPQVEGTKDASHSQEETLTPHSAH
jgi:hypothetical protein